MNIHSAIRTLSLVAIIVLAITLLVKSSSPANADSVRIVMQNQTSYYVDTQVQAPARTNYWPGVKQGWTLAPGQSVDIWISCIGGERICLGARNRTNYSHYWGAGTDVPGGQQCSDCCYTCQHGTMAGTNISGEMQYQGDGVGED